MAHAQIVRRFPDSGFVYTRGTRMLFSPKHCITRDDADKGDTAIVLCSARHWPAPTKADLRDCRDALARTYPERVIYADSEAELIPIYEPVGAAA